MTIRRETKCWLGNIAGCFDSNGSEAHFNRPPTLRRPSCKNGNRLRSGLKLVIASFFASRSECVGDMISLGNVASWVSLIMQFAESVSSFTVRGVDVFTVASFRAIKVQYRLSQDTARSNDVQELNRANLSSHVETSEFSDAVHMLINSYGFRGNDGGVFIGKGLSFEYKKGGPFSHILSSKSLAAIPLVTASAGLCIPSTYIHWDTVDDSKIVATLFATKVWKRVVRLRIVCNTIIESVQ